LGDPTTKPMHPALAALATLLAGLDAEAKAELVALLMRSESSIG